MILQRTVIDTLNKTHAFARSVAKKIMCGDVILLQGPLGSGKSSICREIIRFFIPQITHIPSPTFTIANTYTFCDYTFWHMDLYRIKTYAELCAVGFEEVLNSEAILCVEWPELVLRHIPKTKKKRVFLVTLQTSPQRTAILTSIKTP